MLMTFPNKDQKSNPGYLYLLHMSGHLELKLASFLFQHAYPLYRRLYFLYKNKKDKSFLDLIRKYVKPGSNIIDAGSNIGFYSSFLSEAAGRNGHVYCF